MMEKIILMEKWVHLEILGNRPEIQSWQLTDLTI